MIQKKKEKKKPSCIVKSWTWEGVWLNLRCVRTTAEGKKKSWKEKSIHGNKENKKENKKLMRIHNETAEEAVESRQSISKTQNVHALLHSKPI